MLLEVLRKTWWGREVVTAWLTLHAIAAGSPEGDRVGRIVGW